MVLPVRGLNNFISTVFVVTSPYSRVGLPWIFKILDCFWSNYIISLKYKIVVLCNVMTLYHISNAFANIIRKFG